MQLRILAEMQRRRQAGLLIKALRGKTPEMLEMLDASTAVRTIHLFPMSLQLGS